MAQITHPFRSDTKLDCIAHQCEAGLDREVSREISCQDIRLIAYSGMKKNSGKNLILL